MFQSSRQHATLGGRRDSTWDRSFTVRKAPVFHATFDNRLFKDAEQRDTREIVRRLLESEDALEPKGPSHVFLQKFLLKAKYTDLLSAPNPATRSKKLAIFDDRRERATFQDALRNWADPIYQNSPPGVNVLTGVVDERKLYLHLRKKVRISLQHNLDSMTEICSEEILVQKGGLCMLLFTNPRYG